MKYKISGISLMISMAILLYSSLIFYPRWKQNATNAAISWDVSGYYWYLPSVFIYKDLKQQQFKDRILSTYAPTGQDFQQGFKPEGSNNYVMKYSIGMAVLYTPFFLTAHVLAAPLGYPADGFSAPYQLAIQLGGLLVSLLGLYYFRKLLLRYYSDTTTGITLLLLTIGTNYLNYAAIDSGMSHTWLFTLYVLLILQTERFYQSFRRREALKTGLIIGLAVLIRPTEIISVIIPLCWGISSLKAIPQRLQLLAGKWRLLLLALLAAIVVIALQPLYWHYATGHWIVYSYQDQGFYWKRPHVYNYCFNFQCGWLIYSPLLLLSLLGIPFFLKQRKNTLAVLLYILIAFYVVTAWDIWNYGGFSGRAMIQSYPPIFLVFASFIESLRRYRIMAILCWPLILIAVYVNIWWTWNAHKGDVVDSLTMTRAYFFKAIRYFDHIPEAYKKLRDTDELFEGRATLIPVPVHIEQDTAAAASDTVRLTNGAVYCLGDGYTDKPSYVANTPASLHADWLRASITVHSTIKEWDVWKMPQLSLHFYNKGVPVKDKAIRLSRFLSDYESRELFLDVRRPGVPFDRVAIEIRNYGSAPLMCFDHIALWQFNESRK